MRASSTGHNTLVVTNSQYSVVELVIHGLAQVWQVVLGEPALLDVDVFVTRDAHVHLEAILMELHDLLATGVDGKLLVVSHDSLVLLLVEILDGGLESLFVVVLVLVVELNVLPLQRISITIHPRDLPLQGFLVDLESQVGLVPHAASGSIKGSILVDDGVEITDEQADIFSIVVKSSRRKDRLGSDFLSRLPIEEHCGQEVVKITILGEVTPRHGIRVAKFESQKVLVQAVDFRPTEISWLGDGRELITGIGVCTRDTDVVDQHGILSRRKLLRIGALSNLEDCAIFSFVTYAYTVDY